MAALPFPHLRRYRFRTLDNKRSVGVQLDRAVMS